MPLDSGNAQIPSGGGSVHQLLYVRVLCTKPGESSGHGGARERNVRTRIPRRSPARLAAKAQPPRTDMNPSAAASHSAQAPRGARPRTHAWRTPAAFCTVLVAPVENKTSPTARNSPWPQAGAQAEADLPSTARVGHGDDAAAPLGPPAYASNDEVKQGGGLAAPVGAEPSLARVDKQAAVVPARAASFDPTGGLNAPVLPLYRARPAPPAAPLSAGFAVPPWAESPGAEYWAIFVGATVGSYVSYMGPRAVYEPIGLGISCATGVVGLAPERVAPWPPRLGLFLFGLLTGAALAFGYKLSTLD